MYHHLKCRNKFGEIWIQILISQATSFTAVVFMNGEISYRKIKQGYVGVTV